ncbi:HAD-IA family hydrolase [Amaricoccus tamworthensis]|uniref:HAD-IA family hydrolase n=1 Tax=Amaricoccus tamworthensis TaxID=57002 RepID=UPI003C7C868C
MPGLSPDTILAWDFDGVLNRNIVDGRFFWADTFEEDLNQSLEGFSDHVFGDRLPEILTGSLDLKTHVDLWARQVGYAPGADGLLSYWFERDYVPADDMFALMDTLTERGHRQVLATNNEHHRTAFIENATGVSGRVERVFASGRMGVAKPHEDYFRHVTDTLMVAPERIFFVDDLLENVEAARAEGWEAFHLTDTTRAALPAILLD